MQKNIVITIDGPAGSGKSTSAKLVSKKLGFTYLDTGAMYRAVTYLALSGNCIEDEERIIELAKNAVIDFKSFDGKTEVFINSENVTDAIRTFDVNSKVSEVSRIAGVRHALVKMQQNFGMQNNIVAEGRDTGTVVFPNADVKIFLIASIEERAKRRLKEFEEKGEQISLGEIAGNLQKRDKIDSTREVSPLTKAPDAIEIDTSNITIDEQVNLILKRVEEKLGLTGKNL
jgi:cytidylate kinase